MTERIEKSIDIFLDALNEGLLAKGTCSACACGNLIANSLGIKPIIHKSYEEYKEDKNNILNQWSAIRPYSMVNSTRKEAIELIEKTGFTEEEFKQIEDAFENSTNISWEEYHLKDKEEIREDQINGLKAVISVMMKFDNCTESIQKVFVDKAELIPIN